MAKQHLLYLPVPDVGRFRLFLCPELSRFDDFDCFNGTAQQRSGQLHGRSLAVTRKKYPQQGTRLDSGVGRDVVPLPGQSSKLTEKIVLLFFYFVSL